MEVGFYGPRDEFEHIPLLLSAGFDGRQERLHEAAAGGALRYMNENCQKACPVDETRRALHLKVAILHRSWSITQSPA